MPQRPSVSYDPDGDVLYIATRPGIPAVAEEGLPGVMWRYAVESGELVGVTVLDFAYYWRPRLDELADDMARHLKIKRKDALHLLTTVH